MIFEVESVMNDNSEEFGIRMKCQHFIVQVNTHRNIKTTIPF